MPIPENFCPPIRLSAKEKAFKQLQHWIIDGTLEPGEKLYDAEIAKAIGVSRTPVREALQLLEAQGFIETFPGRDTRVTSVNKKDVHTIYEPLAAMQALAAKLATPVITKEQIDHLIKINDSYKQAIYNKDSFKAMETDDAFHHSILEIADNPYIENFSTILLLHIKRLEYVFFQQQQSLKEESIIEHEQMIEAFKNKDEKKAYELMKKNWLRPMNEIYKLLD